MNRTDIVLALRKPIECLNDAIRGLGSLFVSRHTVGVDKQCYLCSCRIADWCYTHADGNYTLLCGQCHCMNVVKMNNPIPLMDARYLVDLAHMSLLMLRAFAKNTLECALMCRWLATSDIVYYGACTLCTSRMSRMYHDDDRLICVYVCKCCVAAAHTNASIRLRRLCLCRRVIAALPLYDACGYLYNIFLRVSS